MRQPVRPGPGLLALALLAPLVLAGCAQPTPPSQARAEPLSLEEARQRAQATAHDWNDQAELVAASGFEGGEDSPAYQRRRASQNTSFPVHADPAPGDGRAPQWVLVWVAENRSRTMRVTSELAKWLDEGGRPVGQGARAIGEVNLDSTDAVQAARAESQSLDDLLGASDVTVFLTLGNSSRGPEWQIQAGSQSLNDQAALFVDANTGQVVNRTERARPGGSAAFAGTVSQDEPRANHSVTVRLDPARVAVQLSWNRSAAENGTRLSAALFSNGSRIDPAQASQGASRFQARWDGIEAGNYTVQVRADPLVNRTNVSYHLSVQTG